MKLSSKEGRKYTFSLLLFVGATSLLVMSFISGGEWVTAVTITAGVFNASNVMSKKFGD